MSLFAQVAFDNDGLRKAVELWSKNREDAEGRYGPIGDWDTSEVTDMSPLFMDVDESGVPNLDLSGWDASNAVVNMEEMFCYSAFESITLPKGVTEIGNKAFRGCSYLTSVAIPDTVTTIGNGAFAGCSSLRSITIPDTVT
eukprot:CAMPEP_0118642926 /NCGR_PEP_ID=MMETSP0785-20121206/6098_1 /TAXON_ID=91992 /ORGANISM="Bolidomonas pacifica, Strain CCMP 1866" /LENGTH=140 /DNA_ID=CAMNT_0006534515 /DNA_START=993 /DNA_END=1411 /DNA_ORIENTATION=+